MPETLQSVLPLGRDVIFHQVFANAPTGIVLVDVGGRILRANPAFAAMLGRSPDELAGVTFGEITHPDDLDADMAQFTELLTGAISGYRMYKRYLHAAGSVLEARLSVTAARGGDGRIEVILAQVEDVTEQRATERRLREDAARLSLAVEALRAGFWHMDVGAGNFEISPKLTAFLEAERTSPFDLPGYCDRIEPSDLSPLVRGEVDRCSAEYRVGTGIGSRWVRCDRRLVRDRDGRPERIVGVVIDIDEERRRRLESQQEADTDALTGLLNRRGLLRRLAEGGEAGSRGVLAIDLDRFKHVNDVHGHAAGDAVLVECARRLRLATRRGDLLTRIGGDEFVVIMCGIEERQLAVSAERLSRELARPFLAADGTSMLVGGSVGAAWAAESDDPAGDLLEAADRALYHVKADGRGRWRMAG